MIAGMAFANTGLGLAHGFAHPIGARYGIPHGVCCGRLLPHVMRFNASVVPERVAAVGAALTGQRTGDPESAAVAVECLLRDVGIPSGVGDLHIPPEDVPTLARDTLLVGAVRTNPRPVTEDDALAVLVAALR